MAPIIYAPSGGVSTLPLGGENVAVQQPAPAVAWLPLTSSVPWKGAPIFPSHNTSNASCRDALCIVLCYSEFMTISLRNLPKEVEKAILETSHREGISLNKATLRLLEAQLRKPAKNSDFEEFCGTWSSAEADAFDTALVEMRQTDPADWESAG